MPLHQQPTVKITGPVNKNSIFVPIIGVLMTVVLACATYRKKQKREVQWLVAVQQELRAPEDEELDRFVREAGIRCAATIEYLRRMTAELKEAHSARDVAVAGSEHYIGLARSRKSRLDDVEVEIDNLRSDVAELQAVIESKECQVESLRTDDKGMKKHLAKSLAQLERKERGIQEMHAKLREKDAAISESTEQVQEKESRIGVLQGDVKSRDGEIKLLVGDLREVVHRRNRFEKDVKERDEQIDTLKRDIKGSESKITKLTRQNKDRKERLRRLQRKASSAPKVNVLAANVAAASQHIARLREENEQLTHQLQDTNSGGRAGREARGARNGRGGRGVGGDAAGQGRGIATRGLRD